MSGTQGTQDEDIRADLPDNIIGIGNAGKTVVKHYLRQDWILKEGVASRPGDPHPDFQAYIVDTATDEQKRDLRDTETIQDKIHEIAVESGRNPEIVDTQVRYINPGDDAPNQLVSRAGLTTEQSVGRIAERPGIDAWWLRDDEVMMTSDYKQGVLRRRALSKALYYAGQAGDGKLAQLPDDLSGGENPPSTTIVVGLGGGTGSGMFLDLGMQIKEQGGNPTLFAIIPHDNEKDRRRANAYAALSELEYLSMRGKNPFENIILIPFKPARNLTDRKPFLDAISQTIIARESTTNDFREYFNEQTVDGPAKYAPFTLAVPQVLRYDVGEIQQAERAVETYTQRKREALDSELALYEEIQTFLVEEWGGEVASYLERAQDGRAAGSDRFVLRSSNVQELKDRFDALREWVQDEDRFGQTDYEPIVKWRDEFLPEWVNSVEKRHSDLSDLELDRILVTEVPNRVTQLPTEVDSEYPDAELKHRELARVLRDEMRAIKLRGDLFRAVNVLESEDKTLSQAISDAMDTDLSGWGAAQEVNAVLEDVEEEVAVYEANLETIDEMRPDLEETLVVQKSAWKENVRDELDRLVAIDKHSDDIRQLLHELDEEFQQAVDLVNGANEPGDLDGSLFRFRKFDELNRRLEAVGLDPVDEPNVRTTIERLEDAFRTLYDIQNGGLIGRLIGGNDEAKREYREHLDAIDRTYVEVDPVGHDDFEKEFVSEFVGSEVFQRRIDNLKRRREEIVDDVVREFEHDITSFQLDEVRDAIADEWEGDDGPDISWPGDVSDYPEQLRSELESSIETGSAEQLFSTLDATGNDVTDEGVVHEAFHVAFFEPVAELEANLKSKQSDANDDVRAYEQLRQVIKSKGSGFDGTGPVTPVVDIGESGTREPQSDAAYVRKTKTDDPQALQYQDVSDLWEHDDGSERTLITEIFRRFAEGVCRLDDRLPLQDGVINVPAGSEYQDVLNPEYDGHYIGNVFMGRAFPDAQSPSHEVFDAVKQKFIDSRIHFEEDENGYSQESSPFSAPWDLSMTTFVGGVFLDEITPVRMAHSGYKAAWDDERHQLNDGIRIRHVHGIDGRDDYLVEPGQGAFVYRDQLLDFNDDDEIYRFLDSTDEANSERFLSDYVDWEPFESTVDLGTDGE